MQISTMPSSVAQNSGQLTPDIFAFPCQDCVCCTIQNSNDYEKSNISELWLEDKSAVTWREWSSLHPGSPQPPAPCFIDNTQLRKLQSEKLITNVKIRTKLWQLIMTVVSSFLYGRKLLQNYVECQFNL